MKGHIGEINVQGERTVEGERAVLSSRGSAREGSAMGSMPGCRGGVAEESRAQGKSTAVGRAQY